jgi:hypothetical protein
MMIEEAHKKKRRVISCDSRECSSVHNETKSVIEMRIKEMMREKVYDVNNKKMLKFDIKDVFSFPYIYTILLYIFLDQRRKLN